MSTDLRRDTVKVADGVVLPADLAAMLDAIDGFVDEAVAPSGLADRSGERAQSLVIAEYARRRLAAATARVIAAADREADHLGDGHRTVRAWVNAHLNTSRSHALREVQLARLGRDHPVVLDLLVGASLGVAQARLLASAYANPRVREAFDRDRARLLDLACTETYDVFADRLHDWVQLNDQDGSAPDPHDDRRALIASVGETTYLDAALVGAAGAEVAEILDRFTEAEFHADWDRGLQRYGDQMCAALLERTVTQRRADALVAVFRTAAATPADARLPEPVVDLIVPLAVFEEQLAAMVEDRLARFDTTDPARLWCTTTNGVAVSPLEAVSAALVGHVRRVVIDSAGTVIGFGHRQRLFTGSSRRAAAVQFGLQTGGRCLWPGCGRRRTQIDHSRPHVERGPTELGNAGPLCPPHNLLKNRGYRTWRDRDGHWHTQRPDGTPITPV